jgi:DNA primase
MAPIDVQNAKMWVAPLDFYLREQVGMREPRQTIGWVDGGLCPFHDDRHTGDFRVELDSGAFICFACEAKGGDIIDFLRLRDGLSFREAMRVLSEY